MDRALAAHLAADVIENLATPWPYQLIALVRAPDEALAPAERTPMFASCFDWHSSVHNHWALLRLRGRLDDPELRARADRALAASLTAERAAAEERHLRAHPSFERPYGLAWLLLLCAELRARGDGVLAALERIARDRLIAWAEILPRPIRSGEHAQSMFAMALALEWAHAAEDADAATRIAAAARRLHGGDRDAPFGWEPSAYDFLSPALATAWLMGRACAPDAFRAWLDRFAPRLGRPDVPVPGESIDRADGKLAHWDGLLWSRAWMLAEIAAGLAPDDDRRAPLLAGAEAHAARGLAGLGSGHYAGRHWLPSFATYYYLSTGNPCRADRGGAPT